MSRYSKSDKDIYMEVLKPSMGAGAYIKDFRKSDAPQFKGKTEKERDKMAIAAYLDAKDEMSEEEYLQEFLNDMREIMGYDESSEYLNDRTIQTENTNITLP